MTYRGQSSRLLTKGGAAINPTERGIPGVYNALIAIVEPPLQHLVCDAVRVRSGQLMSVTPKYDDPTAAQERRWDAEHYRARARTLRKLALEAKSPEVQRDLIALALRHERLADYIEARSEGAARAVERT